jgi:transposase
MGARRTNMLRLQEIVRLHRSGVSARRTCRLLGMGRNTADRYRTALAAAGLLDGEAGDLPSEATLQAAVDAHVPSRPARQTTSSVADWQTVIAPMVEKRVGAKSIYDFLRIENPEFVGSYQAVKRACRRIKDCRPVSPGDVAIPVVTSPGQVAQVDFFYVGKVRDPQAGCRRKCWAFVMLLAHSRHMFVDLVFDQSAETWQRLHASAFAWFGGVPHVIVPDNLKAAVIRAAFNSSGEIALNRSYVELARYYGFQVDPAPAFAPKKKGKVERAGQYFRANYMVPRSGLDITAARAGIARWVREVAGERIHGITGKRPLHDFEVTELPALKPLPPVSFEPVVWHQAKVHTDSHIQFQRHLYSVPWKLVGQTVWVRASGATVAIQVDGERVATHRRDRDRGRTMNAAHLPSQREQWRHRDRPYWEARAAALGELELTYVSDLFEADDVVLQLRKVQAIVSFLADFPPERRSAACRRASFYGVTGVRAFKDILRKNLDLEPLPGTLLPVHGALERPRFARGAAAFSPTPALEA